MASALEANPESLNVLTDMVNKTLIETGRFFRSGASTHSKAQLKRSIPTAHEKFQSALDELSEQIFIAKAFLERDFDSIQAQKAALQPTADVTMEESNVKQEPAEQPEPAKAIDDTTKPEPMSPVESAAVKPPQPNGNEIAEQKAPEQPIKTENTDDATNNNTLGDQSLSGPGDLNFNTELNNNEGPNDFDLNLDFGDDNIGNENFLSNSNFSNLNPSGSAEPEKTNETPNIPEATHEPQMSDFQTGGDAFDLELQKAGVFTGQQSSDGQSGNNNNDDSMALGQSSFDELFMESENFGGENVGDPNFLEGDSLMQINELDDSWFS